MIHSERLHSITDVLKTEGDLIALREHLSEIVQGDAFRGSRRSAQFLTFVVEKAIEHQTDILKERTIGVELFGRSPAYDTSDDAIVRVTATDVRRRLLQHYGRNGERSTFRITLPTGGYIPEVEVVEPFFEHVRGGDVLHDAVVPVSILAESQLDEHIEDKGAQTVVETSGLNAIARRGLGRVMLLAVFLAGAATTLLIVYLAQNVHPTAAPPWNSVLHSGVTTRVVVSDPDISHIQELTGRPISVSDYANEKYGCEDVSLQNEVSCGSIFHGDKYAVVDGAVMERVKAVARRANAAVSVQSARSIRLPYLRTNDDYIFLGSARSNPWVQLFSDQMDFLLLYDSRFRQEIIRNKHPHSGELTEYIPTAQGFGTGESLATISLVRNPDQSGNILLIEGNTAEATLAAGNLATTPSEMSTALRQCDASRSPSHFQLLLKVHTMAGSSTGTAIVACHSLP